MATSNASSDAIACSFLRAMRRYHDDGVVYYSPVERASYRVAKIDQDGCDVIRLDKRTTVRCTKEAVVKFWAILQGSNGKASPNAFTNIRAQLSSFLQGPY